MLRTRGLYSIIQYVPDGARAEGANAGVALFLPETGRVLVRITSTLSRIRRFFSPNMNELRRIEAGIQSLRHRLERAQGEFKSEADFEHFVAARADAVRLTPPRVVVLAAAEAKVDELFAELVGDSSPVWAADTSLTSQGVARVEFAWTTNGHPGTRTGGRPTPIDPRVDAHRAVSVSNEIEVAMAD